MEITEKIPPSSDVDALEARTDINEKKILRKLDRTLLPVLTLLYLLSFLDRSNGKICEALRQSFNWPATTAVANARLEGLVDDLHMSGLESTATLLFFQLTHAFFSAKWISNRSDIVFYRLCFIRGGCLILDEIFLRADQIQIPCNVVLKLSTPQIWLPTLTMVWGIVATLTGIVQNRAGFFAARFILGVTESGLFPGVVFYLSMWYKRNEQHYRVALFFSAASLAGAFGGILAYVSKSRPILLA